MSTFGGPSFSHNYFAYHKKELDKKTSQNILEKFVYLGTSSELSQEQGWEAWPHAHLNEKLKSINIC